MVPPSLCILASSVCKSLQCLISALTQGAEVVTYLGSRVQLHYGEGGTLRANITGVCGSSRSAWTTPGLPPLTAVCAFPAYTAQAPGCSAGVLSKAGPVFCALPKSKPLRFLGAPEGHRLCWACVLYPSQVQATQATRCLVSTLFQAGHAS